MTATADIPINFIVINTSYAFAGFDEPLAQRARSTLNGLKVYGREAAMRSAAIKPSPIALGLKGDMVSCIRSHFCSSANAIVTRVFATRRKECFEFFANRIIARWNKV